MHRENYKNETLEAMQADGRRDREKRPIGPVIIDATKPVHGYGLWRVALASAVALVVMVLGIIYW